MLIVVYVAFCLLVLWASLRYRSQGWLLGLYSAASSGDWRLIIRLAEKRKLFFGRRLVHSLLRVLP
jgi:hypothetical protein